MTFTATTTSAAIPHGFRALPLSLLQLSLPAVLNCGQSFRWSIFSDPTEYRLCLRDRVICLRQSPTHLLYREVFPDPQPSPSHLALLEAETLAWLKDYFQLDVDLLKLYDEWSNRDQIFLNVKDRFSGIRILRQDPWENLVSFICSSNNNIARISKMVQNLCKAFSPSLLTLQDPGATTLNNYHPFPSPAVLAKPEVSSILRGLGFGYRAEFVQKTAQMLVDAHGDASETWLRNLRLQSTDCARRELLKFMGVGRKVADCVLLMSLDKKEVIPCDTHVHQIAVKHYGVKGSFGKTTMTPKLYEEINTKLVRVWGDYAGWAHSVLFTSDLKSFASYGTSAESTPVIPKRKRARNTQDEIPQLPTPPAMPAESIGKSFNASINAMPLDTSGLDTTSGVKRRRIRG
ncbi:n-glycosylase dna lyase [Moniliophthora roreri MCA 2997]|uniref:DNA-(apurinic or apyrimidinic site) lyase n=1 Tax=Moniliophthora roreri (strain MCA 2997) TaxID=1381753 RepID=V2XL89_MONRO|nr:n-glycosylase dna lyase [Moniliophthora roreri MCA 2997]